MSLKSVTHIDNVKLSEDGNSVIIIDQTKLPNRTEYLDLRTAKDIYDAIFHLKVRGAPAIGIFAGYGMYVLAKNIKADNFDDFYSEFSKLKEYINSSRPTAVNLSHALERMDKIVFENRDNGIDVILQLMFEESKKIHEEDIAMCKAISEYGLTLVKEGDGILTHCNAGPLATSRYGTGLGTLFLAKERGIELKAFCDETRPLLQGARLTTYELQKAGIDCTLICDNMASIVMKEGKINACFVGCDRVAANGDVANKIGTSGVAILAKHYGIPFYVFCPSSTIDFNCETGADIKIEQRAPEEIKEKFYVEPMALPEVKCYNPAFDVTDNELVTAIVTEKGICRSPYKENLAALFKETEK
ncbi:MAG: S-methyl-5-thioribose-1-phosphate isomerase [Firmicutes bacterium]|nr:S-methyl-5-thioribose-1-phosphate isomerase [Bacillota bacterium]MBQ7241865.1 S-methyl-5-thioribose-1-phosphate isomerase [Bacillota bacterium]